MSKKTPNRRTGIRYLILLEGLLSLPAIVILLCIAAALLLVELELPSAFLTSSAATLFLFKLLLGLGLKQAVNETSIHQMVSKLNRWELFAERYSALLDNLAAAIVIRTPDKRVSYCSPYSSVLTGYDEEEMYECEDDFFIKITHPEDRAKLERVIAVSYLGEPSQISYRFFHRSGLELWAETRSVPVYDTNGRLVFILSITFDITSLVRYQKQLEEKNRDIQDMAYMVSHDLRAPLQTVKGMLTLIAEEESSRENGHPLDTLQMASDAVRRLESLCSMILEYARISYQEIRVEEVNLDQVFNDVINDLKALITTSAVTINLPENFPKAVQGDRMMLYQIFSNLLANAINYRSPERPPHIQVRSEIDSRGMLKVEVEDNGIGIADNFLTEIFRPFKRLRQNNANGHGIGLACVQKLIERMEGAIEVRSTPGEGTTFTVFLPL